MSAKGWITDWQSEQTKRSSNQTLEMRTSAENAMLEAEKAVQQRSNRAET